MKLRYVPSSLPDMLGLSEDAPGGRRAHRPAGERARRLPPRRDGRRDRHAGADAAGSRAGTGLWRDTDPVLRRRQLAHMAATCAETYPTLRLHLYDGRTTFAAPFTVFGRIRAAIYLGEAYLVVTSAERVGALSRLFDNLVRRAIAGPERVQDMLYLLADATAEADQIRTRWLSKASPAIRASPGAPPPNLRNRPSPVEAAKPGPRGGTTSRPVPVRARAPWWPRNRGRRHAEGVPSARREGGRGRICRRTNPARALLPAPRQRPARGDHPDPV